MKLFQVYFKDTEGWETPLELTIVAKDIPYMKNRIYVWAREWEKRTGEKLDIDLTNIEYKCEEIRLCKTIGSSW